MSQRRATWAGLRPWASPISRSSATTGVDGLALLPPEAGHEAAEAGRPRPGHELAGQGAVGQRLVGDERDPQLAAGVEDAIGLGLAVEQRVLDLVRGERDPALGEHRVGESHLVGRVVADADRPDLALLDGVGHQVHEPRDRDPAGRVVMHVQVDGRALEELEAPLERPGHRVGPGQHVRRELRRDEDVPPVGQLAEPALGSAGAIHLGGVEERRTGGDAGVEGALLLVAARGAATVGELGRGPSGAPRGVAPGHRPDPQARNGHVAPAQRRRLAPSCRAAIHRTSQ